MESKEYEKELEARNLRQMELDAIVKAAMNSVIDLIKDRQPRLKMHFFYGASAIHPRHLVTWYLFNTDQELEEAKSNGLLKEIEDLTRKKLKENGYPSEGIPEMLVSFTTEEDIQRETGGDHFRYFK